MADQIILKVDDKEISLNPFVQEVFINVINALVASLNKIPEGRQKIEILVKKRQREEP
jgi:hypothetical protein